MDNIRAATAEALAWVKAMCDEQQVSVSGITVFSMHFLILYSVLFVTLIVRSLYFSNLIMSANFHLQEENKVQLFQACVKKHTDIMKYVSCSHTYLLPNKNI